MNINFEYQNVNESNSLEILTAQKLSKLEAKYEFMVSSDVYFKKENTSGETSGKICKVRINTPGPTLFAESSSGAFVTSIATVLGNLKRQLQKQKEKMQTH